MLDDPAPILILLLRESKPDAIISVNYHEFTCGQKVVILNLVIFIMRANRTLHVALLRGV